MNDVDNQEMPARPKIVTGCDALRIVMQSVHAERQMIGLVPTMGALHEGHLSLVRRSVKECQVTVVTIFVNPAQFGPREDYSRYPRTLDRDLDLLARDRADLVFAPAVTDMYPDSFSTHVDPPDVAAPLEGEFRAGHFRGVATVVLKLFNLTGASIAYFGQKDFQQSLVIRHMVRDLDIPIQINVCPIVREPDGLAMSSRNQYLTNTERQQALALSRALEKTATRVAAGQHDPGPLIQAMHDELRSAGITRIDYVALADPETLAAVPKVVPGTVALIAAHVGKTRLIDNRFLGF